MSHARANPHTVTLPDVYALYAMGSRVDSAQPLTLDDCLRFAELVQACAQALPEDVPLEILTVNVVPRGHDYDHLACLTFEDAKVKAHAVEDVPGILWGVSNEVVDDMHRDALTAAGWHLEWGGNDAPDAWRPLEEVTNHALDATTYTVSESARRSLAARAFAYFLATNASTAPQSLSPGTTGAHAGDVALANFLEYPTGVRGDGLYAEERMVVDRVLRESAAFHGTTPSALNDHGGGAEWSVTAYAIGTTARKKTLWLVDNEDGSWSLVERWDLENDKNIPEAMTEILGTNPGALGSDEEVLITLRYFPFERALVEWCVGLDREPWETRMRANPLTPSPYFHKILDASARSVYLSACATIRCEPSDETPQAAREWAMDLWRKIAERVNEAGYGYKTPLSDEDVAEIIEDQWSPNITEASDIDPDDDEAIREFGHELAQEALTRTRLWRGAHSFGTLPSMRFDPEALTSRKNPADLPCDECGGKTFHSRDCSHAPERRNPEDRVFFVDDEGPFTLIEMCEANDEDVCEVLRAMQPGDTRQMGGGAAASFEVRCERGARANPSEVQSLIFDQALFNVKEAKAWAKKHGYKHGAVDKTSDSIRLRQFDPERMSRYRTITLTNGVQAVVGFKE